MSPPPPRPSRNLDYLSREVELLFSIRSLAVQHGVMMPERSTAKDAQYPVPPHSPDLEQDIDHRRQTPKYSLDEWCMHAAVALQVIALGETKHFLHEANRKGISMPDEIASAFPALPLEAMEGMRNVMAHPEKTKPSDWPGVWNYDYASMQPVLHEAIKAFESLARRYQYQGRFSGAAYAGAEAKLQRRFEELITRPDNISFDEDDLTRTANTLKLMLHYSERLERYTAYPRLSDAPAELRQEILQDALLYQQTGVRQQLTPNRHGFRARGDQRGVGQ